MMLNNILWAEWDPVFVFVPSNKQIFLPDVQSHFYLSIFNTSPKSAPNPILCIVSSWVSVWFKAGLCVSLCRRSRPLCLHSAVLEKKKKTGCSFMGSFSCFLRRKESEESADGNPDHLIKIFVIKEAWDGLSWCPAWCYQLVWTGLLIPWCPFTFSVWFSQKHFALKRESVDCGVKRSLKTSSQVGELSLVWSWSSEEMDLNTKPKQLKDFQTPCVIILTFVYSDTSHGISKV